MTEASFGPNGKNAGSCRRDPLFVMVLVAAVLNVMGWGVFLLGAPPAGTALGGSGNAALGTGLAVTAYLLGARHAFDADHIAAIDNTTRSLVARNHPYATTGMWFALGHSTVVVAAVALLAAGATAFAGQLGSDESVLKQFARIWGPAASGTFLLLIGAANLSVLAGIVRSVRRPANDGWDRAHPKEPLAGRGLIARIVRPLARRIDAPWKMYPLGLVFGLGLDTATSVGLLVVASSSVTVLPWQVAMALPLLFTAGMVTLDSLNGAVMGRAYRWAHDRPERRLRYNAVVTGLSVVVAFYVGVSVLAGLFMDLTDLAKGPVAWLASIDLGAFGFVVAGVLLAAWLAAARGPSAVLRGKRAV